MRKSLPICFFLLIFFLPARSQSDIKSLIKVYNSISIQDALTTLSTFKNFKGEIRIDSLKKDSLIIGTFEGDSMTVNWRKSKANIKLITYNQPVFQNLKEQADLKLFSQADYTRGTREISRHTYAYSNKTKMQIGDLWFILAECTNRITKAIFYEVQLITFPQD